MLPPRADDGLFNGSVGLTDRGNSGGHGAHTRNQKAVLRGDIAGPFAARFRIFFWGLIGIGLGIAVRVAANSGRLVNIWRFGDERPRPARQRLASTP
jgi:hypothetical protein